MNKKRDNPFRNGKIKPALIRVILNKFTDDYHAPLKSIGVSAKGYAATDTHKAIIVGELAAKYQSTDRKDVELKFQTAKIFGTAIDFDGLAPCKGEKGLELRFPTISAVVPDLYPVFELSPKHLRDIADAAIANGRPRIAVCLPKLFNGSSQVGFRIETMDDEPPIFVVLMPMARGDVANYATVTLEGGKIAGPKPVTA